jgi:RHH-type proline utilization regulon transcriptional repressor/proline dehydrogenase/delta 1-pyrroline-5-carboxylate dehydrogenase
MLKGAMDTLTIGHPWHLCTDVGPVIDADAHTSISAYISGHHQAGTVLHQLALPEASDNHISHWCIPPTLIKVDGIADMEREIFGPVLHLATFEARDLSRVVADINARGFGLTFGLHTRIDDRVQQVVDAIKAGNVYVNRNQIGAVVGSQPFGGEGLSGTGPKAGGPWYVSRLMNRPVDPRTVSAAGATGTDRGRVLPGPTGESNHWRVLPRFCVLVLSDNKAAAKGFADAIRALGCKVVTDSLIKVIDGSSDALQHLVDRHSVAVVATPDDEPATLLTLRRKLAASNGPLLPLVTSLADSSRFLLERHICIDTTAAGGNASLLGSMD